MDTYVCSYTVRCICTVFLSLRKHQLGAVYMFILLNSLCCHLPVECALEWSIVISLLLPSGSVIDNALTSSNTDNHMLWMLRNSQLYLTTPHYATDNSGSTLNMDLMVDVNACALSLARSSAVDDSYVLDGKLGFMFLCWKFRRIYFLSECLWLWWKYCYLLNLFQQPIRELNSIQNTCAYLQRYWYCVYFDVVCQLHQLLSHLIILMTSSSFCWTNFFSLSQQ